MKKHGMLGLAALPLLWPFAIAQTSGGMVRIPAETLRITDGATQVPVMLTVSGFFISKTEITQDEFASTMGFNPSIYPGTSRPVENISWWQAVGYCNARSLREGYSPCYDLSTGGVNLECGGYRLPSEQEWLLARGAEDEYPSARVDQFANLGSADTKDTAKLMERVVAGTQNVASRGPNSAGIYDMLGNVWEWCGDFNDPEVDRLGSFNLPRGPTWGPERVLRGGSFATIRGQWSRGFRSSMHPGYRSRYTGFRVVRSAGSADEAPGQRDPSWLDTFNRVPGEFRDTLGPLSSLVSQGRMVSTPADWIQVRDQLAQKWERLLGIPDETPPAPAVQVIQTFEEPYYRGTLMYLQVESDAWEKVYLMMPQKPISKPVPAVIVPYYDVDTPAGKNLGGRSYRPPSVRSFAHLLVRQGYIALAVRWFGESYGENYNEAVANLKLKYPQCTGLGKWVWDARRVVDYLSTLPEVDQDRIGMIGHSLGSKMTLYAAALDQRIRVAVASEGGIGLSFSNYEDYWYWGESIRTLPEKTDHHELLGLIAPRPFLMIGGDSADNDNSWHYINAARQVYDVFDQGRAIGYFNHRSGHSPTPESVHLALEWFKYFFESREQADLLD